MEMLVAVTIFSIAIASATTIFVVSNQAQKRAGSLEKIDQQVKYLLEFFTNSLSQAQIDYSVGIVNPYPLSSIQWFKFITADELYTNWRLATNGSNHVWQQCQRVDRYCTTGDPDSDWLDLHSRDLDLAVVSLVVNPTVSPWEIDPQTGAYLSNQQPQITLVLTAKKVDANLPPVVWQTTVTSRLYNR